MEVQFFAPGTTPEYTTQAWYEQRDRAAHLEETGHRERLLLAAEFVADARSLYQASTVSDMGCGDGGLLSLIGPPAWGYDLMPANVNAAINERHVDARLGNFLTDAVEYGEACVLTETLEHLIDPHGFLASVPSRVVIASSPDSETIDSHYEFHTFGWDMDGYRTLFEQAGYVVVRHKSMGFQVLMGVRA